MTDITKYPISGETGLPALPEEHRWYIHKTDGHFLLYIQHAKYTERKFVSRPRTFWEIVSLDYGQKGSYQDVPIVGACAWETIMYRTVIKLGTIEKYINKDDDDSGVYISDIAKILDPETILANARELIKKFDEQHQAKESEKKYVGAYPPGKLNRD